VLCHSERISDAIPYLERSLALEPNHTGAAEFLRQVRQGPVPEVDSKQQPTTDDMPPRPSPYGVAWAFLAAAAVAKLIGSWLSDSEADRASNLPFFQSGAALNRAASVEALCNILMLVSGIVGVVLLIRAAMVRSRSKSQLRHTG